MSFNIRSLFSSLHSKDCTGLFGSIFFSWGKCTTLCRIGKSSCCVSLSSSQACLIPPSAAFQSVRGTIVPFFTGGATSKCLWWEQRNRQSHVAVLEQAGCNVNSWNWDETSGRMSHDVFLSWNKDRRNLVDLHWGKTCTEAAAQGKECNWEKPKESVWVSFCFIFFSSCSQYYSPFQNGEYFTLFITIILFLIPEWGILSHSQISPHRFWGESSVSE